MVGNTHGNLIRDKHTDPEERREAVVQGFVGAAKLREKFGKDFDKIPPAAIGMYNYYDRLAGGLQQFMAGARKFALPYVDRNDLVALTREAAEVSGIPYIMDADKEEVDRILG